MASDHKNTRMPPPLTKKWRETRIGEVYQLTRKPKTVRYSDHKTVPFIPMNLIPEGGQTEPKFIEKLTGEISSGTYFEKGDILLAKITPSFENGKQAIASNIPGQFGVATTEVIPLQAKPGISNARFLFYYLLQPEVRQAIATKMEGSTGRQRVPEHVIRDWIIPLPPLPEQERIAGILSTIQKAIAAEAEIIRNARDLKKSLLRHLFTHGLHNEPLKETEIGKIPESWEVAPFAEVREFLQYGTSQRCEAEALGLPVLRIPNVVVGRIDCSDLKHANLPDREVKNLRLATGDLLFVRTNGQRDYVGRCAVYADKPKEAAFASYLIRARPLQQRVDPHFLQAYTMTNTGRAFLSGRSHGAADGKFNINTKIIDGMLTPLPPLSEQREIASILQSADAKIATHEAKQRSLQELFKTMLNDLMKINGRHSNRATDTRPSQGVKL